MLCSSITTASRLPPGEGYSVPSIFTPSNVWKEMSLETAFFFPWLRADPAGRSSIVSKTRPIRRRDRDRNCIGTSSEGYAHQPYPVDHKACPRRGQAFGEVVKRRQGSPRRLFRPRTAPGVWREVPGLAPQGTGRF